MTVAGLFSRTRRIGLSSALFALALSVAPLDAQVTTTAFVSSPTDDSDPADAVDGDPVPSAAASGEPAAQFQLGLRYEYGDGVARDFRVALDWYRRAAEQGLPAAQRAV